MKNKLLTGALAFALVILLITFSIGLPIYLRFFYYLQIEPLDIPEYTGHTVEEIKDGYDEVLDFLTLPGKEFGTGVFRYSEEGKSHFEDCKLLFDLNISAFFISLAAVVTLLILRRKNIFELSKPFGMSVLFTAGAATLVGFAAVAGLAALDFDRAFKIFHAIFFPGKENWMFDYRYDEIILAMPQEFFRNCAILIVSSIFLISISFIVYGIVKKLQEKKKEQ